MVRHASPLEFDISHPDFPDQYRLWAFGVQCEIMEAVVTTKDAISKSQALLEQVAHMLARKI